MIIEIFKLYPEGGRAAVAEGLEDAPRPPLGHAVGTVSNQN